MVPVDEGRTVPGFVVVSTLLGDVTGTRYSVRGDSPHSSCGISSICEGRRLKDGPSRLVAFGVGIHRKFACEIGIAIWTA